MKKKIYTALLTGSLLTGCSALTGVATDAALGAVTGSATKGMDVTAQVGKENNKGMLNAKIDTSSSVDIDDVQGNANIKSGNTITNDAKTMIGLVLAGMFLPMLLIFYMMPTPRWLDRRYNEKANPHLGIQSTRQRDS